jgi:hypothetical protein
VGSNIKLLNDRIIRNEGLNVIIRSLGFKLKRRSHLPRVTTGLARRRLPHILPTTLMVTSVPSYPFFSSSSFLPPIQLDHSLSLSLFCTARPPSPFHFSFRHTAPLPISLFLSSPHTHVEDERVADRERGLTK